MTPAELYDELHTMFGIGSWVEDDVPWYQARAIEIGKLKRMLTSRNVSTDDVHLAAQYAQANDITVLATWRLFELIPAARKAANTKPTVRWTDLDLAIATAAADGETDWAIRLMNVDRRDDAAVTQTLKEYQDR